MFLSITRRVIVVLALANFCGPAISQQTQGIRGKVRKLRSTGLSHVTVTIDGAGKTETTDSGEFSFPLSGVLKVGFPAIFHVPNWVIMTPCDLRNGRTYLRDPAAEPIELSVVPRHDPQIISARANESLIGCLIEDASQLVPKIPPAKTSPTSSPLNARFPNSLGISIMGGASSNSTADFVKPRRLDVAYAPSVEESNQSASPRPQQNTDSSMRAALSKKAEELGFSEGELRSAVAKWSESVQDPYDRGLAARYRGNFAEASKLISESLLSTRGNILTHYVQLADAEFWQGHYAFAEIALKKVIDVHRDDPVLLNFLASILVAQGKYSDAEQVLQKASTIDHQAGNNRGYARDINDLATVYHTEGRYKDAEPLFNEALTIHRKESTQDDPFFGVALNNAGIFYKTIGQYDKAEQLDKEALLAVQNAPGGNRVLIAIRLRNLALLYVTEQKYDAAQPLYEQAMAIDEQVLGPHSAEYALDLSFLAGTYYRTRQYPRAEKLLRQILSIDEGVSRADPLRRAADLNNLANLLMDEKKFKEAESLFIEALAIDRKMLSPTSITIATRTNNIAELYRLEGRPADAVPLYKDALAIYDAAGFADHPDVADILLNLASALRDLGRTAEAAGYEQRAATIRAKSKN